MEQNNSQPSQPIMTPPVDPKSIVDGKVLAIVGYIGILCLLPLLLAKENPFAKFHGKQGLVLFIGWLIICVVGMVPVLGWLVAFFGNIAGLVLMIVGIINAAKGEMKELPFIGQYAKEIKI